MARTLWGTSFLLILVALTQAAPVAPPPQAGQQFPPGYMDPRPILEAARKAIGNDALGCVTISGSGYNVAVGQQKEAAKQVDWPRPDSLANYTRTMNWDNWTMKEEFDRKPGLTPALWKYGIGWIDGTPIQKNPHQIFMLNGKYGWHMDGANGAPTAVPPDIAEVWPVELVLNPHGFLKAAQLPGANPKAVWRWELGEMGRDGPEVQPEITRIVAINWGKYRIDATVNKENMLQRLHTWVPDSVRNATFPVRVETTKLADGVFLLGGATHNSVAIEFNNYITIFEAPLNEDRSLAVIEEARKLIPNKPIRFVINTNQHFDHAGGLRTYAHIGATIITQFRNFDFYNHDFINYAPRTLKPDMVSLWPPTEFAEGYNYETVRENYVLSDGTRNLNIYYVNPLQKVEGMLMAYLPKERLLLEADLVDTNEALPATLSRDQQSFFNAVRILKLDPARIVPVHGKPIPWSDFSKIAGNKSN